jgi:transposase-like protein
MHVCGCRAGDALSVRRRLWIEECSFLAEHSGEVCALQPIGKGPPAGWSFRLSFGTREAFPPGVSTDRRQRRRPVGGYRPPHCPNPACRFHQPSREWRPVRRGTFLRRSDSARFPRFSCPACGRSFSSRTFSSTYCLRYRPLLRRITSLAVTGAALRPIARELGISHATVARHVARAGRHCLLFHWQLLESARIVEPLVVDGFETFEYSQYFPFHINFAVGAESWFQYFFTDSPLRRKGSMTATQKRKRSEWEQALGCPDPKAVERGMADLLEPLLPRVVGPSLVLHSDDHPAYPRALARLRHAVNRMPPIDHRITSSLERRTRSNPLFPVNLTDLLHRHVSANHRRETIAFSKRRQAALERAAIVAVWRNYIKRQRENGPPDTCAMLVGVVQEPSSWARVLRRRLFPAHVALPASWVEYYWRRVKTAIYGERQATHACLYAF